jgi:uncharacterized protein with PIN domain
MNDTEAIDQKACERTSETAFATTESEVRAVDRAKSAGVEGLHIIKKLVRVMRQKSSIASRGHTPSELLFALTTHRHRRCPYCQGKVYREKRRGVAKLTFMLAIRPYRCVDCDRQHYGFCF